MASYQLTDFDFASEKMLDRDVVYAARKIKPWRQQVKIKQGPFSGQELRVPVIQAQSITGSARPLFGGYSTARKRIAGDYTLTDEDFVSVDIPVEIDSEAVDFDDASRAVGYMDGVLMEAQQSADFFLDMALLCDQNGTLGVVQNVYNTSGGSVSTADPAYVEIDRTAGIGALGRLPVGLEVAIHSGATSTVRVYATVLRQAPGLKVGSLSKKDMVLLKASTSTQTSRGLGGDADDTDFSNVADGDYIRIPGGMTSAGSYHPFGIDAVASGAISDYYGFDQTDDEDWHTLPVAYSFADGSGNDQEFTPELFASALEAYTGSTLNDPGDVPTIARMAPGHFRTWQSIADSQVSILRPISEYPDSALAAFGWKGGVYNFQGKPIAVWVDQYQSPTVIDLNPMDVWEMYVPPKKKKDGWVRDPKSGAIDWQPKRTVSGSNTVFSQVREAHRLYHTIVLCRRAASWLRCTDVKSKDYA